MLLSSVLVFASASCSSSIFGGADSNARILSFDTSGPDDFTQGNWELIATYQPASGGPVEVELTISSGTHESTLHIC